jgi:acyl-CoA thioester hydrolase
MVKRSKKGNKGSSTTLINRTTVKVRFSEVDSLRIVWHGHFIKYFEDGREAFGEQYGFGYLEFYEHKLVTPIVDVSCQYKRQLAYGDEIIIETEFINTEAAKIVFEYKILKKSDNSLVATGKSIQVFLSTTGELLLINPDYFIEWKKANGLLK